MAVVADQVIVELIARVDAYERDLERARKNSERGFRDIESGSQRASGGLSRAVGIMRNALAGLGAAFSVQAFAQLTSAWTDLNSRIINATGSAERAEAVMSQLQVIARRTYSSLSQTAESYLQNSQALTALGYSTQQQLDLSEALNNALVISAARGDRVRQVQDAWSKAMANGSLRGDELNTVIQVGGRLAQALADSLGVPVTQLRRLGEQGKITTDVMYGVTSQLQALRDEADAMTATVSDGFVLLQNAVFKFVGEADKAVGSSSALADALVSIADAIEAAPEEGWFDRVFGELGDEVGKTLSTTAKELAAIGRALDYISNTDPGKAVEDLISLGEGDATKGIEDYELALAQTEQALVNFAVNTRNSFGDVDAVVQDLVQQILEGKGSADLAAQAITQIAATSRSFAPLADTLNGLIAQFYGLRDAAVAARDIANSIDDVGAFPSRRQFQNTFTDLSGDGNPNAPRPTPKGSSAKTPEQKFDEALKAQQTRNDELQRETALRSTLNPLVNDYGYAVEKLRVQLELENAAVKAGLTLTPERTAAIAALAETYATAKVAAEQLDESQKDLKASAEAWAGTLKDATRGFIADLVAGKSAAEAFGNVLSKVADQFLTLGLNNLFGTGGFNIAGLFGGTSTRATGGPAYAGNPTLVGEKGPEIFVPSSPGKVIPNSQLGGGSVTFAPVIDARGADVAAVARLERVVQDMSAQIIPTIRSEMATAKKKGR
jgi:tape measure domain-containing protein